MKRMLAIVVVAGAALLTSGVAAEAGGWCGWGGYTSCYTPCYSYCGTSWNCGYSYCAPSYSYTCARPVYYTYSSCYTPSYCGWSSCYTPTYYTSYHGGWGGYCHYGY